LGERVLALESREVVFVVECDLGNVNDLREQQYSVENIGTYSSVSSQSVLPTRKTNMAGQSK